MKRHPWLALAVAAAPVGAFAACGHPTPTDPADHVARTSAALVNGQAVNWTGLVNATVEGSSLVKTGGQPQEEDSGGVSSQQIASGDASLQFTMSETTTFKFVGFGHSSTWPKAAGIDFSFRMQGGYVDAYENNVYVEQSTGQAGDVFTITVHGNTINYLKNGVSFHTTTKTPTYPLIVAASLIDSGATIQAAQVESSVDPKYTPNTGGSSSYFTGWLQGTGMTASSDSDYQTFIDNASQFDSVHPTWWTLKTEAGVCCVHGTYFCEAYGNPESTAPGCANTAILAAVSPNTTTQLIPTFTATGGDIDTMLEDSNLMNAWAQEIASDATTYGYAGVDLDFEGFLTSNQGAFTQFVTTLRGLLPSGSMLTLAAQTEFDTSGRYNLGALAQVADYVEIMGYDFHGYSSSHAGPVDPLGWAQQVMSYVGALDGGALASHFLWGLPNYGLWGPDGYDGGIADGGPGATAGLASWLALFPNGSYSTDASAEFTDCPYNNGWSAGLAPNGYSSGNHAYFDDLNSLAERVSAAKQAGLGGITYWTIGGEANAPVAPASAYTDYFSMVRSFFPKQTSGVTCREVTVCHPLPDSGPGCGGDVVYSAPCQPCPAGYSSNDECD